MITYKTLPMGSDLPSLGYSVPSSAHRIVKKGLLEDKARRVPMV